MSKAKKSPAKRRQSPTKPDRRLLFLVAAGVLILSGVLFFALRKPATPYTPEVAGRPSLKADKEMVDLGEMKLGSTADVSFELKNVGDQPLRLTEAPYIEVKEGC